MDPAVVILGSAQKKISPALLLHPVVCALFGYALIGALGSTRFKGELQGATSSSIQDLGQEIDVSGERSGPHFEFGQSRPQTVGQ